MRRDVRQNFQHRRTIRWNLLSAVRIRELPEKLKTVEKQPFGMRPLRSGTDWNYGKLEFLTGILRGAGISRGSLDIECVFGPLSGSNGMLRRIFVCIFPGIRVGKRNEQKIVGHKSGDVGTTHKQ